MSRVPARPPARRRSSAAWRVAWAGALWLAVHPLVRAGPPPSPRRPAGHVLRSILAPDRALPPLEPLSGGRLRHRGDGFTATIRPDGSVEFRDVVDHDVSFIGFDVRRRRAEPAPLDRRSPLVVDFEERAMFPQGRLPVGGVNGRFGGLADWTIGQKHVAAKRAFLDATSSLRTRLSYAWQRARMQEQLAGIGDRLIAVWRDPGLSLAERKRRLFALWDECAEPDPAAGSPFDALLGAAGLTARSKIAAFVRLVAPPGSPEAFTADELARLNAARRSAARFEPYRDESGSPPELPELPALPDPDPPSTPDEAAPAYGPTPEPAVNLPERPPERPARSGQKRRREDNRPSVRLGPIRVPLGRR